MKKRVCPLRISRTVRVFMRALILGLAMMNFVSPLTLNVYHLLCLDV